MITIRTMDPSDWVQVATIYKEGIDTGMATFETQIPTYDKWDRSHLKICRFVGLYEDNLAGWAAIAPVSSRHVYRGVAEVSIYIGEKYRGLGLGKALLEHLILESEAQGFWTLQSGIFPLNQTSIKLHESVGFRKIGVREQVGNLNGVWIDNVLFERRSTVIGID
ncbi:MULTISPECIES: GNAT family N-acetyltransferase [Maribacter]|uniref:N-acetyltransferase family protein n=1 Tax=Maribacter flavus TaxID=1658664 RepID=A0ABU7IDF5_9FLAO|nr:MULTISPECIES: GNAT family N-acetyltransferase [Maribacter]MDC6403833.1 GNAT family N-acetyltransferase [Maribacter sp. PR66]MEE1970974.1 N-acetyltransferase family protein [Maribacter flavus]